MKKYLILILALLVILTACQQPVGPVVTPDEPNPPVITTPDEPFVPEKVIEPIDNYTLWNGTEAPNFVTMDKLSDYDTVTILDNVATYGLPSFAHGIAVEVFEREGKTVWVATWAYNKVAENTTGEQAQYSFSYDEGKTWSAPKDFVMHTKGYSASHGLLWYTNDTLYALIPAVDFDSTPWLIKNELFTYNFESESFDYVATPFGGMWPTAKPQQLENGNWIIAGAVPGSAAPCRAISNKNDFAGKWSVKQIGVVSGQKYSETGMAVNGNMVVLVSRNNNEKDLSEDSTHLVPAGRYELGVAVSFDYGETFTKMDHSGIYSSMSKPCCGTLSNGRFYLVFNMDTNNNESRHRLVLAVGDPDTGSINHLMMLHYYSGTLSYPYCVEKDGYLYVAYSKSVAMQSNGNQNDIVMVKVPIERLK